ncbi:MAG: hypothetical protein ABJO36_02340 [Litorimonas sp.]
MSYSKLVLTVIAIGGIAACSAATQKTTTTENVDKKMAHATTVKPGASVTLDSALPESMTSGSFQTVQLRFSEAYSDGPMSVKIEPSEGLRFFGGESSKTFDMSQSGPHLWTVDVKADVDGVYFLNVFAEAQGQPRSFSVRLDMGATTQKMFDDAMPADGELSDGGKIRVLEAEETIQ